MVRLLVEQSQRRIIAKVRPRDPALLQIIAQRLDRPQKLSLLHRESANGKLDRRAFGQQKQRFEQGQRILAAGKRHGQAVAVTNHLETVNGLTYFAQQCFFQLHKLIIVGVTGRLSCRPPFLPPACWHSRPFAKWGAAAMPPTCWPPEPLRSIRAMPRWLRKSCSAFSVCRRNWISSSSIIRDAAPASWILKSCSRFAWAFTSSGISIASRRTPP